MSEVTKHYTNGEVTIVWKPATCMHSTICFGETTGLPTVFNPKERPWIKPMSATTEQIISQVKKCPSGALSYFMNSEADKIEEVKAECIIEPTENGPLLVYGNIVVKEKDGTETHKNRVTAFCRCGHSSNKPYCDGTHRKVDFKG